MGVVRSKSGPEPPPRHSTAEGPPAESDPARPNSEPRTRRHQIARLSPLAHPPLVLVPCSTARRNRVEPPAGGPKPKPNAANWQYRLCRADISVSESGAAFEFEFESVRVARGRRDVDWISYVYHGVGYACGVRGAASVPAFSSTAVARVRARTSPATRQTSPDSSRLQNEAPIASSLCKYRRGQFPNCTIQSLPVRRSSIQGS